MLIKLVVSVEVIVVVSVILSLLNDLAEYISFGLDNVSLSLMS